MPGDGRVSAGILPCCSHLLRIQCITGSTSKYVRRILASRLSAPGHRSAHYLSYKHYLVAGPLVLDLPVVALLARQVLASDSYHVTNFSHGLADANITDMTCHIDYRTCMHVH